MIELTNRAIVMAKRLEPLRPELFLVFTELGVLLMVRGWFGAVLFCLMHGVSLYLLVVFSTPVHRSVYGWTEGCQPIHPAASDFGLHTVLATNDYMVSLQNLPAKLLLFGSFNDHVTHHLFPTVDLSRQHLIREIFLAHCHKHNVAYTERSFFDLFRGLFGAMYRPDKRDLRYIAHEGCPEAPTEKSKAN